jgi:AraC-like DNA-binding protein
LIAVWGIPLRRSPHRLAGSGTAVGTKFAPGAFSGFIDTPASEVNGRVVALADLFGDAGAQLEHELVRCAANPDGHIEAVERFLRERLPAPDQRYELVMSAARTMLAAPPGTTVTELAERYAVSRRTLQRLFREYVGVGPKLVLKRYRMHEAAQRIAAGEVEITRRSRWSSGITTKRTSSEISARRSVAHLAPTGGPARQPQEHRRQPRAPSGRRETTNKAER